MKINIKNTTKVLFAVRIDPRLKFILDVIHQKGRERYFTEIIEEAAWKYAEEKGFHAGRTKSDGTAEIQIPEMYKETARELNDKGG